MKKRPKRRMLKITMIVITIILTRLTAKSSRFKAKKGSDWAKQAVF
jgi:hypothetical protein